MRILLIAPHPFYTTRGTPIAVRLLAETLHSFGHQVDILTFPEGQDLDTPDIRIFRIPNPLRIRRVPPGPSLKKIILDGFLICKAVTHAHRHRYDCVHGVEEGGFIAWALKSLFGIPFVFDMDSYMSDQILEKYPGLKGISYGFKAIEDLMIQQSCGVLAVCQSLKDTIAPISRRIPVHLLEDVSSASLVTNTPYPLETPEHPGAKRLTYVGNLAPYQGIDLLLEGFALALRDINADPKPVLIIVGGNDADRIKYEAMSRDLQILPHVCFLGPRPIENLCSILEQSDVLLSPRTQGTNTPMKIYAYMDVSKPIIATRLETHTQVLNDQNACLVEPNPVGMAEGIIHVIHDPSYAMTIASNAKNLLLEAYSLESYRNKLACFYREIAPVTGAAQRFQQA